MDRIKAHFHEPIKITPLHGRHHTKRISGQEEWLYKELAKEAKTLSYLQEKGLFQDQRLLYIGPSYYIRSFLPGVMLFQQDLFSWEEIYEKLGSILKDLQECPLEAKAELRPLDRPKDLPASVASYYDETLEACLIHGDFCPVNILVGPKGPFVIDFEKAALDHPMLDVVTMILFMEKHGHGAYVKDFLKGRRVERPAKELFYYRVCQLLEEAKDLGLPSPYQDYLQELLKDLIPS